MKEGAGRKNKTQCVGVLCIEKTELRQNNTGFLWFVDDFK